MMPQLYLQSEFCKWTMIRVLFSHLFLTPPQLPRHSVLEQSWSRMLVPSLNSELCPGQPSAGWSSNLAGRLPTQLLVFLRPPRPRAIPVSTGRRGGHTQTSRLSPSAHDLSPDSNPLTPWPSGKWAPWRTLHPKFGCSPGETLKVVLCPERKALHIHGA